MNNAISSSLIKVLREFGVVGVATYIGGIILLTGFAWERDFQREILLGIVGIALIALSIFIAYFRLKIQKDREKALIEMAESTCNRLAEQLGKNMTDNSIAAIIQKIRQTQKDLIIAIVSKTEDKEEN